jgi:hypothetical protein
MRIYKLTLAAWTGLVALAVGLMLGLAGCSKQESTPIADDTKRPVAPTTDAAQKPAETAKAVATGVAESAKAASEKVAAEASGKAQEWIDKAKSLVADNKFSDAAAALGNLSGLSLTDAQKKVVDGLKEQIQKALAQKAASEGASAVGNILGGKK